MSERSNSFFRYLTYVIELILTFILCTTPGLLPEIFGAKPALVVCVALTVAVFEREIPAMIIGLLAGILPFYFLNHFIYSTLSPEAG